MEHKSENLIALGTILCLSLLSCEKLDLTGMFVSEESVNQRFVQSCEWNNKYPFRKIIIPSADYTILSLADCHVGGTNNLDEVLRTAKIKNVTAVVMAGDLTTGHATDYSTFQQHIPAQDSLLSFVMTGNHDLFFDGWKQFYSRFGSSTYYFTVQTPNATDLFICLDSGSGTLGNKQFDWLKNVLFTIRPAYRHCIIFTHNNFFRNRHTSSTNPDIEELTALADLFTKTNVEMVITGHDHIQYAESFGNTAYIVMDALMDGCGNSGYFQLNINNRNISYNFVRL